MVSENAMTQVQGICLLQVTGFYLSSFSKWCYWNAYLDIPWLDQTDHEAMFQSTLPHSGLLCEIAH